MAAARVKVFVEQGKSRVFAAALDWPGWARSGKTEEAALETLDAYAARYRTAIGVAGGDFPQERAYTVVERAHGGGATDFGVLYEIADADSRRWTRAEAERQVEIMRAAWRYLDRVVAKAPPTLAKGPRGGGRDRDPIMEHVLGAEAAYGRSIGVKHKQPALGDPAAVMALRDDLAAALSAPSSGGPMAAKGWPARYAVRRIVWHVLDHAWEIEDKS